METESKTVENHIEQIQSHYNAGDWLGLSDYCSENELGDFIQNDNNFQKLLIRIMETLLENSISSEAKDWYKYILSLLVVSLTPSVEDNKKIISKLFLEAWGSSQLELIYEFFNDNENEIIDTKSVDSSGKSCFDYAADSQGDNCDVIEYLLEHLHLDDQKMITSGLLNFLKKKNAMKNKANSIKEFFKRIDLLDLTQTDYYGKIWNEF